MRQKGHKLITGFLHNDGGREKYGFKHKHDCVVRAIAIVTGKSYRRVHSDLFKINGKNPGTGVFGWASRHYLKTLGYDFIPLPKGSTFSNTYLPAKCIVSVPRHFTSVVRGVLNDTWDSTKTQSGFRSKRIKGYFIKIKK